MRVSLTENMTAFSCLGKRQISAPEEVLETRTVTVHDNGLI